MITHILATFSGNNGDINAGGDVSITAGGDLDFNGGALTSGGDVSNLVGPILMMVPFTLITSATGNISLQASIRIGLSPANELNIVQQFQYRPADGVGGCRQGQSPPI